jgi:hypothetical protein
MLEELSAILWFPKLAHVYSADFGGLNTDCILELFLRKVVLSQNGAPHGGLSLDAVEQAYQEAVQGVRI